MEFSGSALLVMKADIIGQCPKPLQYSSYLTIYFHNIRYEASNAAKVDQIFSGYQACQWVKNFNQMR